ncbi:MAG: succinate dehydrogenase, cytochrome b556 subunit, partial [Brevundimonas sp.]
PLGLLIAFGLTVVLFSFLLNGARHLINDAGQGLTPKAADMLSNIAVWGPVPLAILFFIGLFATGRVSL